MIKRFLGPVIQTAVWVAFLTFWIASVADRWRTLGTGSILLSFVPIAVGMAIIIGQVRAAARFARYGWGGRPFRRVYPLEFRNDAVATLQPLSVEGPCVIALTSDWAGTIVEDLTVDEEHPIVVAVSAGRAGLALDVCVPRGDTWSGAITLSLAHNIPPEVRSFRLTSKPRAPGERVAARLTLAVYGRGAVREMPADVLVDQKALGFPVVVPAAAPPDLG